MSKSGQKITNKSGSVTEQVKPAKRVQSPWHQQLIDLFSHKWASLIIIGFIGFIFYANSIQNEYALDDVMFITMNNYTIKGTEGIEDLIKHESLTGFIGEGSKNIGGRWRPLSLIMFATEWELFDKNPHPKHIVHILIYAILCVSILAFLRKHIFKEQPITSFVCALLFAMHPIHTEVMANIKSRDELLSMLFIVLTLHTSLNYIQSKKVLQLILSLFLYFLALLSKENGMALVVILPLSWYVFAQIKWENFTKVLLAYLAYICVFGLYFGLRIHFVPFNNYHLDEVMNAPFLYATPLQRICTVIMLLGKYLYLLVWPYPLSYDYSYNQIPYVGPTNIYFLVSFLLYGLLLIGSLWFIRFKNMIAYGILFYLLSMFIVSNLIIDTGVVIGERFLFQPSLGFAIAIAAAFSWLIKQIKVSLPISTTIVTLCLVCITFVALSYTIKRNEQWFNDTVLMPHDALVSPNSARALNGGGSQLILVYDGIKDKSAEAKKFKDSILYAGIHMMQKALMVHPKYVDPLLNLGVAYTRLNNMDSVELFWNRADSQYKVNTYTDILQRHPYPVKLYKDNTSVIIKNQEDGIKSFMKLIDEVGVPIKFVSLAVPGDSAESFKETHPKLKVEFFPILCNHYMELANMEGSKLHDYDAARKNFKKAIKYSTEASAELYYNVGGFYYTIGQLDSAQMAWNICLKMEPTHKKANEGLDFIKQLKMQKTTVPATHK